MNQTYLVTICERMTRFVTYSNSIIHAFDETDLARQVRDMLTFDCKGSDRPVRIDGQGLYANYVHNLCVMNGMIIELHWQVVGVVEISADERQLLDKAGFIVY